jgi:hypothetical protein
MPSLLTKRLCSTSTPTNTPPAPSTDTLPSSAVNQCTPTVQTTSADDASISNGSSIRLKRKNRSPSSDDQAWSKERLVYEYQQLMKLRVQASGSIAEATKAHQNAVAASGRVVEQERIILAHVAKKAKRAYREKEDALTGYIVQYEKSKSDSLSACKQQKDAVKAEEKWNSKMKTGGAFIDTSTDDPSVTDIMLAL